MRRVMLGMVVFLGGLATAYATPACLEGPMLVTNSTVFTCGGLTFGNFGLMTEADPGLMVQVLAAQSWDDFVSVSFVADQPQPDSREWRWPRNLDLSFTVSGVPVNAMQLAVWGRRSSVEQTVCDASMTAMGEAGCGSAILAWMRAASPPGAPERSEATFRAINGLRILTELNVQPHGELFRVSERFSTVAEPVTAGTIGLGLLLVGWVYRKARRP